MNKTAFIGAALCTLLAPASLAISSAPADHAAAYQKFIAALDQMKDGKNLDFYEPMNQVFLATQNPLAGQEWMEQAAKDNHPVAQYFVADRGLMYAPVALDPVADAPKWYALNLKAAEAGYVPAIVNQSLALFTGTGVKEDKVAAVKNLLAPCKDNNNYARFKWLQLSNRLSSAADLERKEVQAEITRKNEYVINFAGEIDKDSTKQLEYLTTAAQLGCTDAYYTLAQVFANAKPEDSFTYMQEATRLHHPNAMALMGSLLIAPEKAGSPQEKFGVKRQPEEGLKLLQLAGMLESPLANYLLGESYYYGKYDLTKDVTKAYEHYRKSAAANDPRATLALAFMTLEGMGTDNPPKLGLRLCLQLVEARMPQAVLMLAYAQYKGLGVEANAKKAAELLQEAATYKLPVAYVYLAYITSKGGVGLEPDADKAKAYLRMGEMDLKEKAQQLFDHLTKEGDWTMQP